MRLPVVDHVDEHLDGRLEPTRHAGGGASRGQPQDQEDEPGTQQREKKGIPVNDGEIEQAVLLAVREVVEVLVDVTGQPSLVSTLARHPALLDHRASAPTSSPTVPLRQRPLVANLALRTDDEKRGSKDD
jgi:hypothetical protein